MKTISSSLELLDGLKAASQFNQCIPLDLSRLLSNGLLDGQPDHTGLFQCHCVTAGCSQLRMPTASHPGRGLLVEFILPQVMN